MLSHATSFPVSLLYRLNPTGFMVRRSNMVKSKLLRFSAEYKTTGILTNPELMAPFHNERGMVRPSSSAGRNLWFTVDARHAERRIVDGDKKRSASLTGVHHFLSRLLTSFHPALRFEAHRAIIGTNLHAGLLSESCAP